MIEIEHGRGGSTRSNASVSPGRDRDRDLGATLTELLITVMLLGLVVTSLVSAVIVLMRQTDNTEGRLNVARAETSVGLWMPADLASADAVEVDPSASPCGTSCPPNAVTGGSNVVMLSWTSLESGPSGVVTVQIDVSYRYVQVGEEYQLVRVACESIDGGPSTCQNTVVVRDLGPPPGNVTWTPGVTSPSWVATISDSPSSSESESAEALAVPKLSKQVVLTIDGGGDAAGAGGGLNSVTITAGGVQRGTISPDSTAGTPSFANTRSRCGGTYGVIIDDSGSIGAQMGTVISGVQSFVDAFAGTPMTLQVVRFDSVASVIGESPRTRYFDMLDPADVAELRAAIGGLVADGGTNWEDAFHRMFFDESGSVLPTLPDKVLFFTDGQPTWHRRWATSSPSAPTEPPAPQVDLISAGWYDQESFNRADHLVDQVRGSVEIIGIGVGEFATGWSPWQSYTNGWHYEYSQGFHYETRADASSDWYLADQAAYDAAPATDRRIVYDAPYDQWEPVSQAAYDLLPSAARKREEVYAEPYEHYDVTEEWIENSKVIARIVAGDDTGIPAESVNGEYANADSANLYMLPDWSQFAGALEAVALAECGGTLTVQTQEAGEPSDDTFVYQHTATTDAGGLPSGSTGATVSTSKEFRSGTFDFGIPTGEWIDVEIQPSDTGNLTGLATGAWTCKVGPDVRTTTLVPIDGTNLKGVRVQVRANEALSCIHSIAGS